jgi:hypothetical protein
MKVNQKADRDAAQPHIRQQLRFVDRMDSFHTFHLDDDSVLNQEIHSVPEFDLFALVDNRQTDLAEHLQAPVMEFTREASLISTFQQTRAEGLNGLS